MYTQAAFSTLESACTYMEELGERLLERNRSLLEVLTEVQENLDYSRKRRELWNEWSALISKARELDKENFLRWLSESRPAIGEGLSCTSLWEILQNNETLDPQMRDFFTSLPRRFSDLQNNLDRIMVQRELLHACRQIICTKDKELLAGSGR